MERRYLKCDSMYAEYELEKDIWVLSDVGFSSRIIRPNTFQYEMSKEDFFDIYDGAWPMYLTNGDFADWSLLK